MSHVDDMRGDRMRLIEGDALLEYLQILPIDLGYREVEEIEEYVKGMPTIEERKRGHWERHNTYYGDDVSGSIDPDWRCSECGGQANVNAWCLYDLTDFCPHCGADMRKGEGEKE